jgi:hypothetical protein
MIVAKKGVWMTRAASVLSAVFLFIAGVAPGTGQAADSADKAAPVSVAILDFELVDTSLEGANLGVDQAETARLVLISDLLRELLAASGKYSIVDIAPARPGIAEAGLIHGCNGCETGIAGSLGADRVMTGTVQKVSTLILGVQITERDVVSGEILQVAAAQIRGNTDQSWSRGVRWLVRNRLLAAR